MPITLPRRTLRKLSLSFLLAATAAPHLAHADTAHAKDGKWRGLVGASLAITSGNSNTSAALLNLDLAAQTDTDKTSVLAYINRSSSKVDGEKQTTADKWGVSGQHDRDINDKWFGFGKLGFDGDRLIELTLRSTASAGVGYHLIEEDKQSMDVFGGLSYTDRRYSQAQTIHGETRKHFTSPGALLGEESTNEINEQVAFKQRLELYPDLGGKHAHVAKFNSSLNVSMTQTLSLSVGLVSTYNYNVPAGVKKADTSLFTGMNIKLSL